MANLAKLTEDLRCAAHRALARAREVRDDGTCNLDGVFLRLPRVREAEVIAAIEAAGLGGFKWANHRWYRTGYLISPPPTGQAYKNEVAATAMYQYLRDAGWDVSHWQQMD